MNQSSILFPFGKWHTHTRKHTLISERQFFVVVIIWFWPSITVYEVWADYVFWMTVNFTQVTPDNIQQHQMPIQLFSTTLGRLINITALEVQAGWGWFPKLSQNQNTCTYSKLLLGTGENEKNFVKAAMWLLRIFCSSSRNLSPPSRANNQVGCSG